MKSIFVSVCAIALLVGAVCVVGISTTSTLGELEDTVRAAEFGNTESYLAEAEQLFIRRELLFSLTITDDTIEKIQKSLSEAIHLASTDQEIQLKNTICRLISEIEQIRRHSGLSIEILF